MENSFWLAWEAKKRELPRDLWKDKDMSEKLQGRLQESYLAYQSTIKDIERIVKKIASKLDLDRAAEVGAFHPHSPTQERLLE